MGPIWVKSWHHHYLPRQIPNEAGRTEHRLAEAAETLHHEAERRLRSPTGVWGGEPGDQTRLLWSCGCTHVCVTLTILHVFFCVVMAVCHGDVAVDHWVCRDSWRVVCVPSCKNTKSHQCESIIEKWSENEDGQYIQYCGAKSKRWRVVYISKTMQRYSRMHNYAHFLNKATSQHSQWKKQNKTQKHSGGRLLSQANKGWLHARLQISVMHSCVPRALRALLGAKLNLPRAADTVVAYKY